MSATLVAVSTLATYLYTKLVLLHSSLIIMPPNSIHMDCSGVDAAVKHKNANGASAESIFNKGLGFGGFALLLVAIGGFLAWALSSNRLHLKRGGNALVGLFLVGGFFMFVIDMIGIQTCKG